MKPRLEIFILAGVLLGLAFMAGYKLLVEGFGVSTILAVALMLTPHLLVTMLASSRLWVGIALGGIGLTFSIPLPLLQRLEFGMILVGLLLILVVLRSAFLNRKRALLAAIEDRLMLVVAAAILFRILYDRPGSAQMGESGGLGEAFCMGLGVLGYFMMSRLTGLGGWSPRPTFKLMVITLSGMVILFWVVSVLNEGWLVAFRGLFGFQMWFLSAMVFSWALVRASADSARGPQILPYVVMMGTMVLSVITPFRSRPLFAVGIVMAVAYVHGRLMRLGSVALAGLGLIVLLWFVAGSGQIPFLITRSLSTVMPVSDATAMEYSHEFKSSSEFGWGSGFRAELNRMAWACIRERPIMGKGFGFTRDELLMQSYASGSQKELMSQLATSGVYHNAVIELAVFCGLPLAVIFVLAFLISLIKFVRFAPTIQDPDLRMMAAALLGFFVAESGQMLMNGGGRDFYYICLLLGAMRGLRALAAEHKPDVLRGNA